MDKVNKLLVGVVILLIAGLGTLAFLLGKANNSFGSVAQGGEYFSTSTGGNLVLPPANVLVTGPGALGSVVITGAAAGDMFFYDATTTNSNLRTGQKTTSTILIASVPASAAAGTYTFDVNFSNGLIMDLSGTEPTSTLTWHIF